MRTFKLKQFKAKTNKKNSKRRILACHTRIRIGLVLAAVMFGGVFYGMAISHTPASEAIEPSEFNAGYLIDDSVFYDSDTMTVEEIQNFLDAKSPACDMWGTGLITGRTYPDGTKVPSGVTRSQYSKVMREKYGKNQYHDPPYVCINKYYENPETHETLYETQGVATTGMKSAAQIIYDVAQEYSINPQVLLVLIKKESLVWGDNWPLKYEYNTVMGYGCPDNAPCNEAYYGFYNQVQKAAWQLKYYREHPTSYRYKSGQNNNIQYHPNIACGTKQVYLENIATTSLYIYTPYTPNDAALRAYPGTGDGCSSYGNRNFYMFFREWFGSTYLQWYNLETPRYLTTTENTRINNFGTGEIERSNPGEIIFFTSKVYLPDGMCLRTSEDMSSCYYFDGLTEMNWEWETMLTPRYLRSDNSPELNITTRTKTGDAPEIKYYDQRLVSPAGTLCLKSSTDPNNYCVDFAGLEEVIWDKTSMGYPRKLSAKDDSKYFIDPVTRTKAESINASQSFYFDKQIILPDLGQCLITSEFPDSCLLYSDSVEIIEDLPEIRTLSVNKETYKYNSATGARNTDLKLDTTIIRRFPQRTFVRTSDAFFSCLITEYDKELGTKDCIKYDDLNETISSMTKTIMRVSNDSYKYFVNSHTVNKDYWVTEGTTRNFIEYSYLRKDDGVAEKCYLTEFDHAYRTNSCLRAQDLSK